MMHLALFVVVVAFEFNLIIENFKGLFIHINSTNRQNQPQSQESVILPLVIYILSNSCNDN